MWRIIPVQIVCPIISIRYPGLHGLYCRTFIIPTPISGKCINAAYTVIQKLCHGVRGRWHTGPLQSIGSFVAYSFKLPGSVILPAGSSPVRIFCVRVPLYKTVGCAIIPPYSWIDSRFPLHIAKYSANGIW